MTLTNTKVVVLASIALAMISLTVLLHAFLGHSSMDFVSGGRLIEGFEPDKVASIVIKHGNDSVNLVRKDGGFIVENLSNYAADPKKVNVLIKRCANIRLASKISTDEDLFESLGVKTDYTSQELERLKDSIGSYLATTVSFLDKDNNLMYGVVIGKTAESYHGNNVRLMHEKQVYACATKLALNYFPEDYINRALTRFSIDDIESITNIHDKSNYSIIRDAEGRIKLLDIADGKEFNPKILKQVFSIMSGLRCERPIAPTTELYKKLSWTTYYMCKLKQAKHLVYGVRLARFKKEKEDKYYIKIFTKPLGTVDSKKRVKTDEEIAILDARDFSVKYNDMHSPWIYELSKRTGEIISSQLEDVLIKPTGIKDGSPIEVPKVIPSSVPKDPTYLPIN